MHTGLTLQSKSLAFSLSLVPRTPMRISISDINTDRKLGTWEIFCRVTDVQDLCYFKEGALAVFKFTVEDDTGDIHVVVFGARAKLLSKSITVGEQYVIGSATITEAAAAYNDTGHTCELRVNDRSHVKLDLAVAQQGRPAGAAAAAAAAAVEIVVDSEDDADDAAAARTLDDKVSCACGTTDVCSCFDADFDAPCQSEVSSVVYVLMLERGKYYVGKTKNIDARVAAHLNGEGAAWTRRHHLIRRIRRVTREEGSPHSIELAETIHLMRQVGIENVRGSQFSEIVLSDNKLYCADLMIRDAFDLCNKCGGEGHMVGQCRDA